MRGKRATVELSIRYRTSRRGRPDEWLVRSFGVLSPVGVSNEVGWFMRYHKPLDWEILLRTERGTVKLTPGEVDLLELVEVRSGTGFVI